MRYPRVKFQSKQSRGQVGYLEALVVSHEKRVTFETVNPEIPSKWRPVVRVSTSVVRRRGSNPL
jgi:hypothetical protein